MAASRAYRNNNPGNLRFGPFCKRRGAVNDGDNYAKFPTMVQGLSALADLLANPSYRDLTVADLFRRYAPAGDNNDPDRYARFVSDISGVGMGETLAKCRDWRMLLKFLEGIIRKEKCEP